VQIWEQLRFERAKTVSSVQGLNRRDSTVFSFFFFKYKQNLNTILKIPALYMNHVLGPDFPVSIYLFEFSLCSFLRGFTALHPNSHLTKENNNNNNNQSSEKIKCFGSSSQMGFEYREKSKNKRETACVFLISTYKTYLKSINLIFLKNNLKNIFKNMLRH